MKYLLISLLFSLTLFSQESNKLDAQGKKEGLWKGIYEESKRPRYEGTFSHGKEIGKFVFFDDTKAVLSLQHVSLTPRMIRVTLFFLTKKGVK